MLTLHHADKGIKTQSRIDRPSQTIHPALKKIKNMRKKIEPCLERGMAFYILLFTNAKS